MNKRVTGIKEKVTGIKEKVTGMKEKVTGIKDSAILEKMESYHWNQKK